MVRNQHPASIRRIPVTNVEPVVEAGAYPAKAVVGEEFPISANVFREGHDAVAASVILTAPDGTARRIDMAQVEPLGLDIFEVWVRPDVEGDWTFRVEGWSDPWHTWLHHAEAKLPLEMDVPLLCLEAQQLFERASAIASEQGDTTASTVLRSVGATMLPERPSEELLESVGTTAIRRAMAAYGPRELVSPTREFPLRVERRRALFSSWYEFFPRSQGAHQAADGSWVSGTFASSYERLEAAAAMGFDIVYLPPVHPIGTQFRKGRNNTLTPGPDDPGSPWAIGSSEGGHDTIHPDLGTMADFEAFVAKARELGLEVAMDFALQASPDHPWVTEHPQWFSTRADGTIAYAENPPKKYQDIYPINFDNDPEGIYAECKRLLKLWISKGVTVFRVDNPHTKPVDFWAWLLGEIHAEHPEVIFLAEAFTRPAMMHALGKVGYQQSYTYFTWRTERTEIEEYLTELSTETAPFYRPSFWVNTPDINPFHLQSGNPAAFSTRAVLAATLSPSWGVYSGFELCEHLPVAPGREEYLDSEKYEYRPRDWEAQPNLSMLLGRLNEIRRANPALQQLRRIHFHHTSNDDMVAYSKRDGSNVVLVVCSLAPERGVEGEVHLDLEALGAGPGDVINVTDQLTGASYHWGGSNFVRLSLDNPSHIFLVRPL
ncbi:alpha-1,4-glucan--maltose-1-phosphate maltosyltransferase [Aestuariimicrobium ganziense]|uniref:alpha-1,4-glucan--maltose-1-phosphate maltosyltransferase n=1 Tax=Aestuariimicrobium ganziense TaxID=2773677 RepID=UPI002E2A333E|nr:alpha-1,4-glucan--maltose-1-phosphate maltosyltransferase [Aestuariimicrobium ganziense]